MYTNAWTGMFSTWNYCCHRKINLRKHKRKEQQIKQVTCRWRRAQREAWVHKATGEYTAHCVCMWVAMWHCGTDIITVNTQQRTEQPLTRLCSQALNLVQTGLKIIRQHSQQRILFSSSQGALSAESWPQTPWSTCPKSPSRVRQLFDEIYHLM